MSSLAFKKADLQVNTVWSSYDYEKFNVLHGNRTLINTNLNNLRESFSKKVLDVPIIVNEKMEIIDGQHRYMIRREMGLPITYMIVDGCTLEDCILLNTVSQKWSSLTFLNSYCDQGVENYIVFKNFMDEKGLSLEKAFPFFSFGTVKGKVRQDFKNGNLEIVDIEKTQKFYNQYLDFKDAPAFENQLFMCAVIQLFGDSRYDHSIMQEKLKYQAYKLKVRSYLSEYTEMILDVYNYRTRTPNKLTK